MEEKKTTGFAGAITKILGNDAVESKKTPHDAKEEEEGEKTILRLGGKRGLKKLENQLKEEENERKRRKETREKRLKREHLAHIVPEAAFNGHEQALKKVATHGVLRLFNAMYKHNRALSSGNLEKKPSQESKEKLTKNDFFDMLHGKKKSVGKGVISKNEDGDEKLGKEKVSSDIGRNEVVRESAVSWLQDDFMIS